MVRPTQEKAQEELYTIGKVAEICNVSRKTLRFYEELGVLEPDYVCQSNSYRYYSKETMSLIPVLKYYKQIGFKLQEMSSVKDTSDYFYHEKNFLLKMDELKKEEQQIRNSHKALNDWVGLLREGTSVIENNIQNVSIKYIEEEEYVYQDQPFSYDYRDAVINVDWVNYLEKNQEAITGPVILQFNSCQEKAQGKAEQMTIMQKLVGARDVTLPKKVIGGGMYICSYHIGDFALLPQKYQMIHQWAKENGYSCGPEVFERYVIDYWSTKDVNKFVVEILFPAKKL